MTVGHKSSRREDCETRRHRHRSLVWLGCKFLNGGGRMLWAQGSHISSSFSFPLMTSHSLHHTYQLSKQEVKTGSLTVVDGCAPERKTHLSALRWLTDHQEDRIQAWLTCKHVLLLTLTLLQTEVHKWVICHINGQLNDMWNCIHCLQGAPPLTCLP